MKKLLFFFSAFAAMAMAFSCNKDNNGGSGSPVNPRVISKKVVATANVQLNADYFRYADYTVIIQKDGEIVYNHNLDAPEVNHRSDFSRTYAFEQEGTLLVKVICTPKSVEYETAQKTVGDKTFSYVIFNTNKYVGMQFKDFDASDKQIGGTYGYSDRVENKNQAGEVDDTHGFGAADLNYASLRTDIQEGKTVFERRNLTGYSFTYKIVNTEEGLTAQLDE